MEWHDRVVVDPEVLTGKPVVRGTRISVELVVDLLAAGWSHAQVLTSYPHLTEEDIRACLSYASELLPEEGVYPLKSGFVRLAIRNAIRRAEWSTAEDY
jgi:uncharacterized protein (DUF433 family)